MFKTISAVAVLLCMTSYAAAGTDAIGTAIVRGDMRVDGYTAQGNATLFDGSIIETGQASANLRLGKDVEITMASNSRGTLYRDRIVLQQGASELTASSPFQLQAYDLRVTPTEPNSRAMVSLGTGNTVEVSALTGGFGVTDDHGVVLGSVRPALALASFPTQSGGGSAAQNESSTFISDLVGLLDHIDGHYYLTDIENNKYELTGKNLHSYAGDKVVVSGTLIGHVITVKTIQLNGPSGMSAKQKLLYNGVILGAAAGGGYAVYEAVQSPTPASP